MNDNMKNDYKSRAKAILLGEVNGRFDQMLSDRSNKLAYAFLMLLKMKKLPVYPVDDSQLGTDRDIEYLESVEDVKAFEIELEYEWYKNDLGAFIAYTAETNEPVIMHTNSRGEYEAYNPFSDTTTAINAKTADEFQRKGIAVYATHFLDDKITAGKLFLKSMKFQTKDILIFVALSLFVAVLGMFISLAVGFVTSAISFEDNGNDVLALGAVMVSVVLASLLINIVINRTKSRIASKTKTDIFISLISRVMNVSSANEKKISSSLIALLLPFLNSLETVIESVFVIVLNFVQVALIISVMRMFGDYTATIVFIVVGYVLIMVVLEVLSFKIARRLNSENVKYTNTRIEFLDHIEAIKNNAVEERMLYRFAVCYDEYMNLKLKQDGISQWITIIGSFISGFGVMAIFFEVAKGNTDSLSTVTVIVSLFSLMINYVRMMLESSSNLIGAWPQLKYASDILNIPLEKEEGFGESIDVTGDIEFSNVTFSYSGDSAPVIKNLSFHIHPGEYVGIVGGSGCGKSTLIRLIMGFEKPDSGNIIFDGKDMSQLDIQSLRRQYGVVLQDAAVITGNIRMNIGMSEDADMELVTQAARLAAIDEEIEAMPMKYNTILSSEAEVISGGQRQRIALARALINKPKILILDEATSAMDNVSQSRVKRNLDELGVTRIVVAHRLSTIQDCDRILVMDKGKLVEEGDFNSLIAKNGLFAKMAKRNM